MRGWRKRTSGICRQLPRWSAVLLPLVATGHAAVAGSPALCYQGVNLSGAEYGDRNGVYGTNYIYPSERTVLHFAAKGMTIIRLPFRWERLQPRLGAALDANELKRLSDSVALIRKHGMAVLLDPHNFGYYDKGQVGKAPATNAAFADFWARLAVEFANREGVAFGLMNEPYDIKATDWLKSANAAIRAIRIVGARNLVLVPGTVWSGAGSWEKDVLGGANGTVMLGVKDPLDNYGFEVHQYFDVDSSGTHESCEGADNAVKAIAGMTTWLKQNNKRGFLGEFGVSSEEACVEALSKVLKTMGDNGDAWLGWSYWAAGEWWPPGEAYNVQPQNRRERPQAVALNAALDPKVAASSDCAMVKPATN
ncbi:cellulase (glycosyl hydrolase family 5) [Rhizobium sp. BK251]|nr:cellulase (glycosyl hydrolase family 5) [Rhizobium sp. BK251]